VARALEAVASDVAGKVSVAAIRQTGMIPIEMVG
jgi:hypothetical protein